MDSVLAVPGLDGLFLFPTPYSTPLLLELALLLLVNNTFMCDNGTNLLFSQYNDTEHRTS